MTTKKYDDLLSIIILAVVALLMLGVTIKYNINSHKTVDNNESVVYEINTDEVVDSANELVDEINDFVELYYSNQISENS